MKDSLHIIFNSVNRYDLEFAVDNIQALVKQDLSQLKTLVQAAPALIASLQQPVKARRRASLKLLHLLTSLPDSSILPLLEYACLHERNLSGSANSLLLKMAAQDAQAVKKAIALLTSKLKKKENPSIVERLHRLDTEIDDRDERGWVRGHELEMILTQWFRKNADLIELVLFYGSRFSDTYHKNSDLDVAIVLKDNSISDTHWLQLATVLQTELSQKTAYTIDLQWFQNATTNPAIYDGLAKGCLLISAKQVNLNFHLTETFKNWGK